MGPEDVVVCFLYRGELVVVCFLHRGVRLRVGRWGYCVWHIVTSMTYVLGGGLFIHLREQQRRYSM